MDNRGDRLLNDCLMKIWVSIATVPWIASLDSSSYQIQALYLNFHIITQNLVAEFWSFSWGPWTFPRCREGTRALEETPLALQSVIKFPAQIAVDESTSILFTGPLSLNLISRCMGKDSVSCFGQTRAPLCGL